MKTIVFQVIAVFFLFTIIQIGCQKQDDPSANPNQKPTNSSNQNLMNSNNQDLLNSGNLNPATNANVESIVSGLYFWKMEIAKDDFVDLLDDAGFSPSEISALEPQLIDPVVYVLGINDGYFIQYLSYVQEDEFEIITSGIELVEPGTSETLAIVEDESAGTLSFNGNEMSDFEKLSSSEAEDFEDFEDYLPLSMCCRACYLVHHILDIHELDCICCFLGDGCPQFSCDGSGSISYNVD